MRLDYTRVHTHVCVRGYILESTLLLIPFIIPDDPFSMPLKIPISARQCCPPRTSSAQPVGSVVRRSASLRMPLRRQPRPCPRLRASIYRRWYPRLLSPVSLFFSSQSCCFFVVVVIVVVAAVIILAVVDVAHVGALPTEAHTFARFSSFPTCYHLVNHRAIGRGAHPLAFAKVFPSCERVSFIHMPRGKKPTPAYGSRVVSGERERESFDR